MAKADKTKTTNKKKSGFGTKNPEQYIDTEPTIDYANIVNRAGQNWFAKQKASKK